MHCPFLIMCKVSIPASSFLALQNNLNTSIGAVTRFTARYRYFHCPATCQATLTRGFLFTGKNSV